MEAKETYTQKEAIALENEVLKLFESKPVEFAAVVYSYLYSTGMRIDQATNIKRKKKLTRF